MLAFVLSLFASQGVRERGVATATKGLEPEQRAGRAALLRIVVVVLVVVVVIIVVVVGSR